MKAIWWTLAYLSCLAGCGWLALALEPHWQQVRGPQPLARRTVRGLRVLGTAGVLGSLGASLGADHASMAVLVWVMNLAAAALTVAFLLTWRPRLLAPLLVWVPGRAPPRRPEV